MARKKTPGDLDLNGRYYIAVARGYPMELPPEQMHAPLRDVLILDSACCNRVVWTSDGVNALERARHMARRLNREEREWEERSATCP